MNTCEKPNYIFKNYDKDKWKFLTHAKYIREASKYPIVMEIPCGHCKACLENQAFKLKQRLLLELEESKTAYFITLTYNNWNLTNQSCKIEHLRKFTRQIKEFYRYNYGLKNIKFFGVSEYGDQSLRPHYHIIIFNIPIWQNDFKELDIIKLPKNINNKTGITYWINDNYFTNTKLANIWKKGRITISNVNESRIDYMVNYMYKSMNDLTKDKKNEMKQIKMEMPTRIQSQNLGLNTILKNKNEFLTEQYIHINGERIYANKYIDKKAGIYNEERSEKRLFKRLEKIGKQKKLSINNHKGAL